MARSDLVVSFVEEAMQILASSGHAAGTTSAQRMAQTLLAATADPALAAQLAEGMLRADAPPGEVDLSWGTSLPSTPRRTDREALVDEVERLRAAWQKETERADRLEVRAREAEEAANRAAAVAAEAKRTYEEAAARLEGRDE